MNILQYLQEEQDKEAAKTLAEKAKDQLRKDTLEIERQSLLNQLGEILKPLNGYKGISVEKHLHGYILKQNMNIIIGFEIIFVPSEEEYNKDYGCSLTVPEYYKVVSTSNDVGGFFNDSTTDDIEKFTQKLARFLLKNSDLTK